MNKRVELGESSPPAVVGTERRLILIAEDDEFNRKLILLQLGALGYTAEIACNGEDALRMWRRGNFALLFTDLHMPGMDGHELIRAIRAEEAAGQRLPIFALTASASDAELEQAQAAGMDGCLTKPIDLLQLRNLLEQWLPRHGEQASTSAAQPARAVDVRVLKNLVGNDDLTVRDFLGGYRTAVRRQADELRAAFAAGDAGRVGDAAHKMKAASHSVGAAELGALCARIEDSSRAVNREAIAQHMAGFESLLAAVEMEIAQLLEAT